MPQSGIIFLCVKPVEYKKNVLDEIRSVVQPSQIVISITSPVLIEQLEDQLPCKIVKMIPSITNFVLSGATLCIHGSRMSAKDIDRVENLLGYISAPIRIAEQNTRISSDLSSCGPAFLAFFLQKIHQRSRGRNRHKL